MSLSTEIERVDGAQNDILKALAQSYGINTSGLKIDQVAAKVKASQKFKLDSLLSTATAGKYDLGADATPNDAFEKIKVLLDALQNTAKIVQGSYVGTGELSKTITLGFKPKLLILAQLTSEDGLPPQFYSDVNVLFYIGQSKLYTNALLEPNGTISISETGITLVGDDAKANFNLTSVTYRYVGVG